ncbi:MAG TPA: UvrD-helicase domain-containing protein [Segeticoccus sp.]|uniref:UvrD-helicase domain-containing protein n=1 Tax=Segeticoccus sp. TaxID=2706531 RepID=UPI002D80881D|nr:UvrD-helicase domain-containing protein [Segeticoccus sp.]HET8598799.1 UvrD-helicase domain-containing protein [Segeticoccus sp.]
MTGTPGAAAVASVGAPAAGAAARHFDIADPLPQGTVLLEASAGTGKTWTIAALVTRYVAEGVVELPEMLVVTFGRAASQELRARVREQLVCAERALADPSAVTERDELVELLLDADDGERARRLQRVRAALTSFDSATIATTHQFCHQVLRSLGVAGNTDAGAQLVEDLDDLLVEVVDDLYLRGFVGDREEPFFSRSQALAIARRAIEDSHAALRPDGAEPGSEPDRRVKFAHVVRRELDLRKRRLQVMHYNDLLSQLAEALEAEDSPARARMRQRWRVVLVDEFQDTDPVQWQVLDRAFTGHALAMVLIGDPKQAIYAFRGGDVVTYLGAAATAAERRTLPRNYRTDAGLVDALGVLLGGAALGDEQILVHPVEAHQQGVRLQGAPHPEPFRLRQVLGREHLGGDTKMPAVRPHVARDLALDVAQLLASGATFEEQPGSARPLRAKDVAFLAHTSRTLLEVQQALREVGIHAVSAGGSNVLQSRAAHEWLALLEAMAAPHRSMLTRAAALTDLIGLGPEDLDSARDGRDALDDELAARMRRLADVYARQGIAAVLEDLTARGLPARVLGRLGGERDLTDLRHVGQLLHEASGHTANRVGLLTLLDWLTAQMADDAPQSSGARTRRLDSDAAAVQLVTIHGSKGLQYPVVYLPSLFDRWVAKTPDIPLYHELPERTRCLDLGGDRGPGWQDAVAGHKKEDAGESLRLLYVALTRAQSQVVAWWAPSSNTAPAPLHRLLFGREPQAAAVPDTQSVPRKDGDATAVLELWSQLGAFALERADHAPEVAPVDPGAPPKLDVRRFTRSVDTAWRRTSYTALSTPRDADGHELTGGVGSEPESTPREDEPEVGVPEPFAAAGVGGIGEDSPLLPGLALPGADLPSPMGELPVGATFGSLVHAVLEHTDPGVPDLRAELLERIGEQLIWWPVEQLDAEELANALVAVHDSPLGPLAPGVTLRDIGRRDRLCELDFELPLGGGDRARAAQPGGRAVLGDLVPLLRKHLRAGDPVRGWADVLEAQPALAQQELAGYLTGSVDVVLRTGGRYLVVDYKTNWLGSAEEPLTAAAYRPEALVEAMGHSSYPLQALLYAVVAHRFLRWRLPGYDPPAHFGGVLYLYLRGMCGPDTPVVDGDPCGVFSWHPSVRLVTAVSDLLDGRRGERPAGGGQVRR